MCFLDPCQLQCGPSSSIFACAQALLVPCCKKVSRPPFSPGLGERMTSHALQICQGVVVTQLKEWTRPSLPRGQASYTCQSPQQSPMPHFCWLRRSECCHPTCKDLQAGCWAAGLACQLSWVIVCCVALCNSVKKLAVPAVHLAGSPALKFCAFHVSARLSDPGIPAGSLWGSAPSLSVLARKIALAEIWMSGATVQYVAVGHRSNR